MENIHTYTLAALKSGSNTESVKANLMAVGWSHDEANEAIAAALVASGVPTPERGHRVGTLSSTVEVVLNFFSFILLGIVATALATLYYQIINYFFPDPLLIRYGYADTSSSAMHYSIAALVVAFPLYASSVRMWFKRFREDEDKVESKLTKWLTYLVLLITAVTIVGDLIVTVFYFLQGEVSARFFFKALTILLVAGSIFGFYFLERKKIQYKNPITGKTFHSIGLGVTVFVVIGIILGFSVSGSPKTERMRGLDSQRSSDLMNIANCVSGYAMERKQLPATLFEIGKSSAYAYCMSTIADPETGIPYTYRITNPMQKNGAVTEGEFELCATFALPASDGTDAKSAPMPIDGYSSATTKWNTHSTGEECDLETVILDRDTTLTPPRTVPVMSSPGLQIPQ